jgi:micrococcal nuclease
MRRVVLAIALIVAVAALVVAVQSGNDGDDDAGTTEPTPTAITTTDGSATQPAGVPGPSAHAEAMRVRYVFDGDTVELQAEQPGEIVTTLAEIPVRLTGVDTPEVNPETECYGAESTAFLRALLPEDTRVLVDRDRDGWDDFERRLLYLWLEDGRFVNYEIVAQGYGEAIRVWPNVEYHSTMLAVQAAAEQAELGLWGAC